MRLAHHSDPSPARVDSDEVFRWNRTDASQFVLLDPLSQGWQVSYVEAALGVPAHLLLSTPSSWTDSVGPAFLLLSPDLQVREREVVVIHDLFPVDSQILGPVLRYLSESSWIGARWDIEDSVATLAVDVEDSGDPERAAVLGSMAGSEGQIVRSVATSQDSLYGAGSGSVWGHGLVTGSEDLYTDLSLGFGAWFVGKDGAHGGESVRIFDVVVREGACHA